MKKKYLILAAVGVAILTGCTKSSTLSKKSTASVIRYSKSEPKGDFQSTATFSEKASATNDDFDSYALLNNQEQQFKGFKGQGYLWLKAKNNKDLKVFINSHKLNVGSIKQNYWNKISIKDLTKNGANILQVDTLKNKNVKVKIPYPTLKNKANDAKYKNNDSFKLLDAVIKAEIKNGFSSAQLVVVHNGKIIKQSSYGMVNSYSKDGKRLSGQKAVTNNTLYDLASNTKMYATNYAIQRLVSEGKLNIDSKVSDILPNFKDQATDTIKGKSDLTVREILEHQAGFPADPQYHNQNYNSDNPLKPEKNKNIALYTQNRNEVLDKIIATPLDYTPGTKTVYSDVDYMLLGFIIEKITNTRLDQYVNKEIYKPLALKHITFNPLENGLSKNDTAATELDGNTRGGAVSFNNIRKNTLQGQVHDEKAYYSMKGVSGHAGLFSNATDLAKLAQIVVNGGGYGNYKLCNEETLQEFIKPKSTDPSYGLGWRRNATGTVNYNWAFSKQTDSSTVGHTGWTGTLTVIDPKNNNVIILLTNERNTPLVDAKKDPNDFAGGHYLLAKYGDVVNLAVSGINNDSKNANDQKIISLVSQRYAEIKENKADNSKYDKADLRALFETLKDRDTTTTNNFLKTTTAKNITSYLKGSKVNVE